MNILIDDLPESLNVDGADYKINTDYRTAIKFETMTQNEDVPDTEKISKAMALFFCDNIPSDFEKAIEKIIWFYSGGENKPNNVKGSNSEKEPNKHKIYDYDIDAGYIYAAFLEQYGIDLQETHLHWWKFKALFCALSENIEFVKIMAYRTIKINPNMSKEQQAHYRKMKKLHALPLSKTEDEKLSKIEAALMRGESIHELL